MDELNELCEALESLPEDFDSEANDFPENIERLIHTNGLLQFVCAELVARHELELAI